MVLFECRDLVKSYEDEDIKTNVLRGLSFIINKGEFVSIMGPSGSGKSTLLHILGFLSGHSGGVYQFAGKEFNQFSEDEIAHIRNKEMGFVFQSFNLLGRSTVYENVRLPLIYSGRPESEWDGLISGAIEAVGLEHRRDYETYKLSGGEKQRTAIARALVNEPRVIFADEPTGNLDSVSGGIVMGILQRLHQEMGHTILLITHESETAEHAERIIRIFDGKLDKDFAVLNRRLGARESFRK